MDLIKNRTLIQDADQLIEKLSSQEKESSPKLFTAPVKFNFGQSLFPQKQVNLNNDLVTFVEVFYNRNGALPVKENFLKSFPQLKSHSHEDWEKLLTDLTPALVNRGIPCYVFNDDPDYLEPHFVLAVGFITNPLNKKSINAKLKDAGLSVNQWNALLKNETHRKYFDEQVERLFNNDTVTDAKLAITELIGSRDLQAVKFFYEVQNLYRPHQKNEENLMSIIATLMEIIAENVSQEAMVKIANEFSKRNILDVESTAISGEIAS